MLMRYEMPTTEPCQTQHFLTDKPPLRILFCLRQFRQNQSQKTEIYKPERKWIAHVPMEYDICSPEISLNFERLDMVACLHEVCMEHMERLGCNPWQKGFACAMMLYLFMLRTELHRGHYTWYFLLLDCSLVLRPSVSLFWLELGSPVATITFCT